MTIMRLASTPPAVAAVGDSPEAEPGAVEHHPVADADKDRDQHESEDRAGRAERDARDPVGRRDRRRADVVVAQHAERARLDQQSDDAAGDGVQHDRRDHLADAAGDLEDRRQRREQRAAEHRDSDDHDLAEHRRHVQLAADDRREHRADPVLALDADVEQVHLEPDRDGDADQVVHAGAVDDVDGGGAVADLHHHRGQRLGRVAARNDQRHRAQQGREHDRRHRRQQLATQ
jgi:hypothetical protein